MGQVMQNCIQDRAEEEENNEVIIEEVTVQPLQSDNKNLSDIKGNFLD